MSESSGTDDAVLRLRPGARVLAGSTDELQIMFPNHTVTFSGPDVVRGVRALTALFRTGQSASDAAAAASRETGLTTAFLAYLVRTMRSSHCLCSGPVADGDELRSFLAYAGEDPQTHLDRLGSSRIVVVTTADLTAACAETGLNADLVVATAGTPADKVLAEVRDHLDPRPALLAAWNLPYRLPLAGQLNELALAERLPILFGAVEGLIGRVGPVVLPGNSACLECANRRLLAGAGAPEMRATTGYRALTGDTVPEPWPAHPGFTAAIARLFAIELAGMAVDLPSRVVGGFVEYEYPIGLGQRRPVSRVPRCPSCSPARPPRAAWDISLPAPIVKAGR